MRNSCLIEIPICELLITAGLGNYWDNISFEMMPFRPDEVPDKADLGVRISGNSMEPKISDGDIVWVKECSQVENGEIGIFIFDGDAYCKKLKKDTKKRLLYLVSLNPDYDPIKVGPDDRFYTIGRVLRKIF